MSKKKYNKAIIVMFIGYIGVMIIFNLLTPLKTFSEEENRQLQMMPIFSFEKLKSGEFTKQFEAYIADQFPKRDFFVSVKSESEMLLGKKENNDVYRGKDGYLMQKFFKGDDKDIKDKVEAVNTFFENTDNINRYFMLVPNSIEILKDKLPFDAPVQSELAYINVIKSYLNKDVKFIDVYNELASKKEEDIYYKTDHHWTTDGAYYAYEKFCEDAGIQKKNKNEFDIKTLTNNFYGTSYSKSGFNDIAPDTIKIYDPKDKENYKVKYSESKAEENTVYSMDKLNQKDKYAVFLGGNHPIVKITTGVRNAKKLLVIKDSYANSFVPFLTSAYSEIYMIDLRYYDDSVSKFIKSNKINNILFLYNVITFAEDNSIQLID